MRFFYVICEFTSEFSKVSASDRSLVKMISRIGFYKFPTTSYENALFWWQAVIWGFWWLSLPGLLKFVLRSSLFDFFYKCGYPPFHDDNWSCFSKNPCRFSSQLALFWRIDSQRQSVLNQFLVVFQESGSQVGQARTIKKTKDLLQNGYWKKYRKEWTDTIRRSRKNKEKKKEKPNAHPFEAALGKNLAVFKVREKRKNNPRRNVWP